MPQNPTPMKKLLSLFLVIIILLSGCQKESTYTSGGNKPGEIEEKESLDFVTFKDGSLPVGWKTYSWEITTIGFDDGFSLKSANPTAIVATTKTMHAPAYIQFYTKGENIDLYIDEEKAKVLVFEEVGTWKKSIYPIDSGKHTFTWQTEGALKYLDAVSFLFAELPEVELLNGSYTTFTSAILKGNVISHGNHPIIAQGVCWSKNRNPTIADNKTSNYTGLGLYTSCINNLTSQTTYYVRAYATNQVGTGYSEQTSFKTK